MYIYIYIYIYIGSQFLRNLLFSIHRSRKLYNKSFRTHKIIFGVFKCSVCHGVLNDRVIECDLPVRQALEGRISIGSGVAYGKCLRVFVLITYLLNPWSRVLLEKITGSAASQEIPRILWYPKVHYRTNRSFNFATSTYYYQLFISLHTAK